MEFLNNFGVQPKLTKLFRAL